MSEEDGDSMSGLMLALLVYFIWGFLPFYMKAVSHIPAAEVVAHRVAWSLPIAGGFVLLMGQAGTAMAALRQPRVLLMACLCAVLITINWTIYVYAVSVGHTLETALGYYINPLLSVLLGAVFLREKLSRLQWAAIALAGAAVVVLSIEAGGLPWVSLGLAVSWAFYALARRTFPVGPNEGFFIEILLLSVPAIAYIAYAEGTGQGHFVANGWQDSVLLAVAGLVTAVPLLIYANGAKRLRLSTIGILQYVAPTLIFLVAVFAFREPFSAAKGLAFALIWTGVVLYVTPLVRAAMRKA